MLRRAASPCRLFVYHRFVRHAPSISRVPRSRPPARVRARERNLSLGWPRPLQAKVTRLGLTDEDVVFGAVHGGVVEHLPGDGKVLLLLPLLLLLLLLITVTKITITTLSTWSWQAGYPFPQSAMLLHCSGGSYKHGTQAGCTERVGDTACLSKPPRPTPTVTHRDDRRPTTGIRSMTTTHNKRTPRKECRPTT